MAELHLLGIRKPHHGRRMEAAADFLSLRQRLVLAGSKQVRGIVLDRRAAGELEVGLELADDARLFLAFALGLGGGRRHDAGPLVVGVDQALGFGQALLGVAAQQAGVGTALQHVHQLPAQVEGVLHRDVHALAGLGRMGVAGVAGGEHARVAVRALGHVVKLVGDAVADVVDRPPDDLLHVQRIGFDDAVGGRDHVVLGELLAGGLFAFLELVEFHVHAEHIAAFARQDQHIAFVRRRDQALLPHVREVGVGEDVHHAPGLVGGVAMQFTADGLAHRRVRAVAAHHIVGAHGARGPPVHAAGVLERHRHRVVVGGRVHRQADDLPAVVGLQPRGRVLHHLQEQLVQPRLVDQDVRHFRAVVGHVLHPAHAPDVLRVGGVGHPEVGLVDPVGLALDLVGEAEGLEHFHGARVDAVGLALDDVGGHALDDHRVDVRKLRQLRRQAQAGRPGAGDQHIDLLGQRLIGAAVTTVRCGLFDVGVSAAEAIFVELHGLSPGLMRAP